VGIGDHPTARVSENHQVARNQPLRNLAEPIQTRARDVFYVLLGALVQVFGRNDLNRYELRLGDRLSDCRKNLHRGFIYVLDLRADCFGHLQREHVIELADMSDWIFSGRGLPC
jgi:hypothetical protein